MPKTLILSARTRAALPAALLTFLPALSVALVETGGSAALVAFALLAPGFGLALHFALRAGVSPPGDVADDPTFPPAPASEAAEHTARARIERDLTERIAAAAPHGRGAACLVLRLEQMAQLADQLEPRLCQAVCETLRDRATAVLRDEDEACILDREHLAIAVGPGTALDLETMMNICSRVQIAVNAPLDLDAAAFRMTATIGLAMARPGDGLDGAALITAAEDAMMEARLAGAGAIRTHTPAVTARRIRRHALQSEARDALETGGIVAWYQPQIDTDTGRISGFEALARWHHPDRGWITPGDFLPALAAAGCMPRVSAVMLDHALNALRSWDRAGFHVPRVSINLAQEDLRDPTLPRRIAWELDRYDIAPHRLCLEILETVMAGPGDTSVFCTLADLKRMGCGIDLDDFGTGNASITAIQSFPVGRIKIDRSFIDGLETDADKQRMIAAILTMAERLGVDTLAEGVETAAQHALVSQLGCAHVQGFGIGRPMPFEATMAWIVQHDEKLVPAPQVSRKSS